MFIAFEQMSPDARVWVYQANKFLDSTARQAILNQTEHFLQQWDAHGKPLRASAIILHNLFLVVAVDESYNAASGCSIDASVHFLKELGNQLQLDFFDRSRQALIKEGNIQLEHFRNLKTHIGVGMIEKDTLTFNPSVSTLQELQTNWQIPAGESWLAKYF